MTSPEITDALAQEIRRVDGNNSLGAGALAEALMPFLSAALAAGAPGVKVKALVWVEEVADLWWSADCYRIEVSDGGGFAARVRQPRMHVFTTLAFGVSFEAAKAAAQADYEARVLSALEPASSALVAEPGEPVAWEQRHRENSGEWSKWYPTSKKAFDLIGTEPDGSLQARPLYAAPPARQDGALREALEAAREALVLIRSHSVKGAEEGYSKPELWADALYQSHGDVAKALKKIDAALAQSAAPVQHEPAAWPSGFFPLLGDARLRECVTQGCGQHASIRIERDGVGSDHCEPCARKIAEFVNRPVQQAAPSGEGE